MHLSSISLALRQQFSGLAAYSPSLLLDFTSGNQTLDPRITFTRASTATYFNSAGVLTTTGFNLLLYSKDLSSGWTKGTAATWVANAATAPDGTMTALQGNGVSGFSIIGTSSTLYRLGTTVSGSTEYTFSIYLRTQTGTATNVRLRLNETGGNNTLSSDLTVTTEWTRFSLTVTTAAGATVISTLVGTGSGTADLFIWGAQLETGSAATVYIPTTAATSGAARFDYDPATLAPLGLLIEEQRTNLYTNSFINQTGGTGMTYSNGFPAPDPAQYFVLGQETTDNGEHFFQDRSFTPTVSTTYAFSVYAKQGPGNRKLALRIAAGNVGAIIFDLTNGTASSTTSGVISNATITPVGNGVYRCTVIWTATSATTTVVRFQLIDGVSTIYTGDGYSGINIWGAQLEAGAFATSYIPTVASQVTRAADVAVMTGTNFSSWYNATEGTAYIAFVRFGTTSSPYPLGFTGGTSPTSVPRITLRTDTSMNIQTQSINSSSVTQWNSSSFTGSPGFNAQARAVMAFADSNIGGCVNGNAVTQISSGTVPTDIDKLFIGFQGPLNGHISRIAYYPRRLTNAELQGITS